MAGLVPAIHVFFFAREKNTWTPGTSPRQSGSVKAVALVVADSSKESSCPCLSRASTCSSSVKEHVDGPNKSGHDDNRESESAQRLSGVAPKCEPDSRGLGPAIHVFFGQRSKTWTPGPSPGVTKRKMTAMVKSLSARDVANQRRCVAILCVVRSGRSAMLRASRIASARVQALDQNHKTGGGRRCEAKDAGMSLSSSPS